MDVLAHEDEEDHPRAVNNHWSQVHLVHHEPSALIVPMTETGFTDVGWLNPNLPTLENRSESQVSSHKSGGAAHIGDVDVLTLARVSRGLRRVSLFLLRLLTCSTTREKWDMALRPSLACRESSTSWDENI